ncbi:MAG TPA: alpha/beta hydrolase [Gaiellaceae bacterium]|nr:alpha/beta hydrolase [Gaiellaceae bacterium]
MDALTTVDGRRLSYRRLGSGPVLVCHPGGPGFSSRYFGDLAGLGDRFTLVLLNPRGTEGSHRPADPRAYTTHDYVADLDELRAHLALDRMLLLGHSHGGVVAQAYAGRYPDRVERLVLASTLARFQAVQEQAMQAATAAKAGEPWYEDASDALKAEQEGRWTTDEELAAIVLRELPFYFRTYGEREQAYLRTLEGEVPVGDALRLFNEEIFTAFDLRPALDRITAPTLVLTGEDDFICGPVCARELADGVAGSETILLPECGHFVFVERAEAFADAVNGFLGLGRT